MWAFWNVGRLAERLYGKWTFLFLYLASGVLASLSSIAWNPSQVSIGASGAIFGIFGAFLAFLAHRRSEMPAAMLRAHWISTLAFVVFNLVSGVLQTGIDNAAHFGGIASGFVLGWVLARPLTVEIRSELPFKEGVTALLLCAAAVVGALWQVQGLKSQLAPNERFLRSHAWYAKGEAEDLRRWQVLASQAGAGTISDAELGRQFERDILPFWTASEKRLHDEAASIPPNQRPFASLLSQFVRLRSDWARAVIDVTKNRDANRAQDAQNLSVQTTLVQARLERMAVRSGMDHRARALSNSTLVVGIRGLFSKRSWRCVEAPPVFGPLVAPSDAPADGPAARDKTGCLAQSLFMSRNYAALDALISHAAKTLGDLPDGGSTISGIFGGLSDLFEYGAISIDEALVRTADWRRQVAGSLEPDLVEALIFESWAWGVRGHGSAPEVSQQAWAIFAYREEMADASLEDTKALAAANPYWYQLSLSIGLAKSVGVDELRARFDRGVKRFPGYLPLYGGMLRILMPRWLGSYQKVAEFITDASNASKDDVAMYARLYWMYDLLEQDDVDIFRDASANWSRMRVGFEELKWLYPHSDVVLNAFARFACIADDEEEYSALRPSLIGHVSATAWTAKVSLKTCDAKRAEGTASSNSRAPPPDLALPSGR
jgi:Rhomboid family